MSDKLDNKSNIIIDLCTGYCKSGFETDEIPASIISCLVGRPKYSSGRVGFDKKKFFIGKEAEAISGVLNINNPVSEGVINNWDEIEKLLGKYGAEKFKDKVNKQFGKTSNFMLEVNNILRKSREETKKIKSKK